MSKHIQKNASEQNIISIDEEIKSKFREENEKLPE